MTQEEKDLLLKDLSARLPYGVICLFYNEETTLTKEMGIGGLHDFMFENMNAKPYLRPLTSLTKEEREEWADLFNKPLIELESFPEEIGEEKAPEMFALSHISSINWLYSKHINVNLPEHLYIAVTKENNPYKD